MGVDLAEGILRHSGYLNAAYVRMTPEDRRSMFHEGESALYITRGDHRIQSNALDTLKRENQELRESIRKLEEKESAIKEIRADPKYQAMLAQIKKDLNL